MTNTVESLVKTAVFDGLGLERHSTNSARNDLLTHVKAVQSTDRQAQLLEDVQAQVISILKGDPLNSSKAQFLCELYEDVCNQASRTGQSLVEGWAETVALQVQTEASAETGDDQSGAWQTLLAQYDEVAQHPVYGLREGGAPTLQAALETQLRLVLKKVAQQSPEAQHLVWRQTKSWLTDRLKDSSVGQQQKKHYAKLWEDLDEALDYEAVIEQEVKALFAKQEEHKPMALCKRAKPDENGRLTHELAHEKGESTTLEAYWHELADDLQDEHYGHKGELDLKRTLLKHHWNIMEKVAEERDYQHKASFIINGIHVLSSRVGELAPGSGVQRMLTDMTFGLVSDGVIISSMSTEEASGTGSRRAKTADEIRRYFVLYIFGIASENRIEGMVTYETEVKQGLLSGAYQWITAQYEQTAGQVEKDELDDVRQYFEKTQEKKKMVKFILAVQRRLGLPQCGTSPEDFEEDRLKKAFDRYHTSFVAALEKAGTVSKVAPGEMIVEIFSIWLEISPLAAATVLRTLGVEVFDIFTKGARKIPGAFEAQEELEKEEVFGASEMFNKLMQRASAILNTAIPNAPESAQIKAIVEVALTDIEGENLGEWLLTMFHDRIPLSDQRQGFFPIASKAWDKTSVNAAGILGLMWAQIDSRITDLDFGRAVKNPSAPEKPDQERVGSAQIEKAQSQLESAQEKKETAKASLGGLNLSDKLTDQQFLKAAGEKIQEKREAIGHSDDPSETQEKEEYVASLESALEQYQEALTEINTNKTNLTALYDAQKKWVKYDAESSEWKEVVRAREMSRSLVASEMLFYGLVLRKMPLESEEAKDKATIPASDNSPEVRVRTQFVKRLVEILLDHEGRYCEQLHQTAEFIVGYALPQFPEKDQRIFLRALEARVNQRGADRAMETGEVITILHDLAIAQDGHPPMADQDNQGRRKNAGLVLESIQKLIRIWPGVLGNVRRSAVAALLDSDKEDLPPQVLEFRKATETGAIAMESRRYTEAFGVDSFLAKALALARNLSAVDQDGYNEVLETVHGVVSSAIAQIAEDLHPLPAQSAKAYQATLSKTKELKRHAQKVERALLKVTVKMAQLTCIEVDPETGQITGIPGLQPLLPKVKLEELEGEALSPEEVEERIKALEKVLLNSGDTPLSRATQIAQKAGELIQAGVNSEAVLGALQQAANQGPEPPSQADHQGGLDVKVQDVNQAQSLAMQAVASALKAVVQAEAETNQEIARAFFQALEESGYLEALAQLSQVSVTQAESLLAVLKGEVKRTELVQELKTQIAQMESETQKALAEYEVSLERGELDRAEQVSNDTQTVVQNSINVVGEALQTRFEAAQRAVETYAELLQKAEQEFSAAKLEATSALIQEQANLANYPTQVASDPDLKIVVKLLNNFFARHGYLPDLIFKIPNPLSLFSGVLKTLLEPSDQG